MDTTRRGRLSGLSRDAARHSRTAARRTGSVALGAGRRIRRVTHAKGAGESGLGRLIELHGVNTAGDAMVAVALANTLFFSVPTGQARGRVALYLLITMAPFAVMAPIIGPLLDRFRHGRRWAIALTLLVRAFLAWVLAGAVANEGLSLYPAAFGCLVGSKAYGVTRSATVPRLLPEGGTLVAANSRISLAGIISGAIGAGLAAGISAFSLAWSLRVTFLVFCVGTVLALRLPGRGRLHHRRDADHALARRHGSDPAAQQRRHGRRDCAARQRCAARLLRLPDHVLRVPAARAPDRRPEDDRRVRAGRGRGRRRFDRRHDDRVTAEGPPRLSWSPWC